jgi:hypothetical protein
VTAVEDALGPLQQCQAADGRRHQSIVSGLKGHPPHEIAQALAESDAKNPSAAECAQKKPQGGGGGDTATVPNNSTGDPALDGVLADANGSAIKTPTSTSTSNDPPKPKPDDKKKIEIGAAAAGGIATIFIAKGGGGGTPSGGATPSGGGTTPTPTPTPTPAPTNWDGVYVGVAHNVPGNTTCPGVTPTYDERATVQWTAPGRYNVMLHDNPSFDRTAAVSLDSQNGFSASGSAPFNASETYSGSFSVVNGTLTLTLTEVSNFGTCSTTNTSVLSKQ